VGRHTGGYETSEKKSRPYDITGDPSIWEGGKKVNGALSFFNPTNIGGKKRREGISVEVSEEGKGGWRRSTRILEKNVLHQDEL